MGALFGDEDGAERTGGFVWDGEQLHRCSDVTVVTSRDHAHTPQAVTVSLTGGGTTWTFIGEAHGSVPLRHRSADGRTITRISETAMTWTTDGDTRVHGMAEYLDQMADGVPVGLRV
jgi:hypothetical protein